jgi:hypothetical protein
LLEKSHDWPGFYCSHERWTIPIFETGPGTAQVTIGKRFAEDLAEAKFLKKHSSILLADEPDHPFGHADGFGPSIPMPAEATPDAMTDGHLSIVDRPNNIVYDMWGARRNPDGTWDCWSGITYPLDGPGVFDPQRFDARNGETIHLYGPCRASGTPNIAGLVRHDELVAGRIEHKLAFATRYAGLLAHCFPAIWTDGAILGGPPEGIVVQLDPDLRLDRFDLSGPARTIAAALQEYGAVLVDVALGSTLSFENLNGHAGKSWTGLITGDSLMSIPFRHFRFIKPESVVEKGSSPIMHPIAFQTYHELLELHDEIETPTGRFVGWPKDWYDVHVRRLMEEKAAKQ